MLKLISLTVFLVNFATLSIAQLRVIGSKPAFDGQFPYQVSLQYNGTYECGGSIIAPNHILTAAHCVLPEEIHTLRVVAGLTNFRNRGVSAQIRKYTVHSKYNSTNWDNDAAILELKENLPIGSNFKIQIIKLVAENVQLREGDSATVSGWGKNKPDVHKYRPPCYVLEAALFPTHLQYATVSIWDHKRCSNSRIFFGLSPITANMICAKSSNGKADACNGDSGGPLVVNSTLAGIVSFGPNCESPSPGVYTKVAAIRSWIREVSGV